MIQRKKLKNGIILSWNDDLYPNLLDARMVIYKSNIPDGTFYIGKTKQTIQQRFENGHCSLWSNTLHSNKIRKYGITEVEILSIAKTIEELDFLEKENIHNALKKLGYNISNGELPIDEINKRMLNKEYYIKKG